MKNLILASMLFFLFATAVEAQFSVRPQVGINSTNLTRDFADAAWQSGTGYQIGLDVQLGNKIYVQPGLHWELIRSNFNPNNPQPGWNTKFRASHIRIPLMLGFRAIDKSAGGLFNLRVYTGPDVAFRVSNSDHSFLGIEINRDRLKNLHWSWNAGLGVDILFMFIDVGYKFGLSDYFEASTDNGSRSNVFFTNIGLRFGI